MALHSGTGGQGRAQSLTRCIQLAQDYRGRMTNMFKTLAAMLLVASSAPAVYAKDISPVQASIDESFAAQDAAFQKWMGDNNVPGLVWGVVKDGKLIHVTALGVQDLGDAKRPVTADTGFRIASMSKAFTGYAILKLRDAGKLRLDDKAVKYVPEIKGWAGDITVADLLFHTSGMVTDDPWGDRQQVMPEAEFTKLLKAGVPRTAPRGTRYEYSNMGFAMLGRIISNVSGTDYASYVRQTVFNPLGMKATTYEIADVPMAKRAIGYRWENAAWAEEPTMRHGAFGAMGGIVTTANDYAKWIGFLLSGWPAVEGDAAAKQTIRAMQYGGGLTHRRSRPGKEGANCRITGVYAAGLASADDCILGPVLFHGGGFPGYGSHMLLIPDLGVGIFALSNRTYAGPSAPVWDAATDLMQGGFLPPRIMETSPQLADAYEAAKIMWREGSVVSVDPSLAMNFFMDRSAKNWAKILTEHKEKAGRCDTSAAIVPTGKLSGRFSWTCVNGMVTGNVLLAPHEDVQIQSINWQHVPKTEKR
jgi:serine-type D-Ala-D-Ala carboxypeptidase/endopeptidase